MPKGRHAKEAKHAIKNASKIVKTNKHLNQINTRYTSLPTNNIDITLFLKQHYLGFYNNIYKDLKDKTHFNNKFIECYKNNKMDEMEQFLSSF